MEAGHIFLINRLIHQVKNELATLQLASANLNYLLQDFAIPVEQKQQAQEFLNVIRQNLKNSVQELSRILVLTRHSRQHFEPVNLGQIILELCAQTTNTEIINGNQSLIVNTEPQAIRWFLETLLHTLQEQTPLKLEIDSAQKKLIFHLNQQPAPQKVHDEISMETLILKTLARYLNIQLTEFNPAQNDHTLVLSFNGQTGETHDV